MTSTPRSTAEVALRHISTEQFLCLGMPQVVYLRTAIHEGHEIVVIHGADGMPLAAVETFEDALMGIADRGLGRVTLN